MGKKTIAVIMLIVILFLRHSGGGIVSPTYGQDGRGQEPLLAFSTLRYVRLPDNFEDFTQRMNCESPLAAPRENMTGYALFSIVQIYDPSDGSIRCIAGGADVLWSNTGRYLAVLKLDFDDDLWSAGPIDHFTIWDTVTHTAHAHDYQAGTTLYWTPDDKYLVVTGHIGGSTYGQNTWVDIFPGDAAIDFTPPNRPGFTGIMGGIGGTFFRGFTVDNRVLLYTQPYREQPYFTIVDPATGEEQPADLDATWYYPIDSSTEAVSLSSQQGNLDAHLWDQSWGMKEDYIASGDGRFLAVAVANMTSCRFDDLAQIKETPIDPLARLLLIDMENNSYQEIDRGVTCIWRMAWQP
ncbi:MAG: hypothetical protein GX573_06410 [Chloroflexi bacterium]|nr:hypothetical protein [Chloroflexota bacterium]